MNWLKSRADFYISVSIISVHINTFSMMLHDSRQQVVNKNLKIKMKRHYIQTTHGSPHARTTHQHPLDTAYNCYWKNPGFITSFKTVHYTLNTYTELSKKSSPSSVFCSSSTWLISRRFSSSSSAFVSGSRSVQQPRHTYNDITSAQHQHKPTTRNTTYTEHFSSADKL